MLEPNTVESFTITGKMHCSVTIKEDNNQWLTTVVAFLKALKCERLQQSALS